MSYGAGGRRKKVFHSIKAITQKNIQEILKAVADQFASEYPKRLNDNAAERENDNHRNFLRAVAHKDFVAANDAFQRDTSHIAVPDILQSILKEQAKIDYNDVPGDVKQFLGTTEARGLFYQSARAGIRRILQAPLQMGLSRTVLQKYLQTP